MNNQAVWPTQHIGGEFLSVHSIFRTIQGEGPLAGCPATFIRLAGCNLQCVWCDTDYTSNVENLTVGQIIDRVMAKPSLVVITGGEPMRQDISLLVSALKERDHYVQIETNGTIYRESVDLLNPHFVISPKTRSIDKRFMCCYTEHNSLVTMKMVFGENNFPSQPDGRGGVPDLLLADYIIPLDIGDPELNKVNAHNAAEFCIEYNKKLSIQIHKVAGVP